MSEPSELGDEQERLELMADILEGLYGPDIADLLDDAPPGATQSMHGRRR